MLKAKEKQKFIKELGNGSGEISHMLMCLSSFLNNIRIF